MTWIAPQRDPMEGAVFRIGERFEIDDHQS
jgi:hypothetical protein